MKKTKLLLIAFFISLLGYSQGVYIKGKVFDEEGNALPGATVMIKAGEGEEIVATLTDLEGGYSIKTLPTDILVVSFIGYKTQEIPVEGRTIINITMEVSVEEIDEVVVVGYGVQAKKSVVASIAQTKGEELLTTGNVGTVSEALQGLLPGVIAINSNSKPGDDAANIVIRGISTWGDENNPDNLLNDNSPLTLIDGIEANINDVDFNEIETISVLKDASATAVYGSKGGNGVILITTKRGSEGKAKVNLTANFGFKQLTAKEIEFGDHITALELYNEAYRNDNLYNNLIPESTIEAWKENYSEAGPYNQYFPKIDWFDELIKDFGYQQQYNLNISGGTKFVKYYNSLGYLNDGDVFKTEKNDQYDSRFRFQRINWRSNFDFLVTSTTKLSLDLTGKMGYRNQAGYRTGNIHEGAFWRRMYEAPTDYFPLRYEDGHWGDSPDGTHNMVMALNNGGQRIYKTYDATLNLQLEQKLDFITKGLSVGGKISYKNNNNYQSNIVVSGIGGGYAGINVERYYREYDYANPQTDSEGNVTYPLVKNKRWPDETRQIFPLSATYDTYKSHSKQLNYNVRLNYKRGFGSHNISLLALFTRNQREWASGGSFNLPQKEESWVGRVTYNWNERYLAEFNASYMGHEKFAQGKRFDLFPSFSLGWRMSEEPLIKDNFGDIITNLKIRYSYGEDGNYKGGDRFLYLGSYNSGGNVGFGTDSRTNYGPLYTEDKLPNIESTWESSVKQNFGIELKLWERLSSEIDLFKEKREGILMKPFSAIWLGATSNVGNIGITKNHGIEIILGWEDKLGTDFKYSIKGNMAFSENRIVYRQDPRNAAEHEKEAGKPIKWQTTFIINDFYQDVDDIFNATRPNLDVDQRLIIPGDFMYVDYNADGIVDSKDQVVTENVDYPLTTYSLTLNLNYKQFGLMARLYAVTNLSKDIPPEMLWDFPWLYRKVQPNATERWTPETAETATRPAVHYTNTQHNQKKTTFSYQDASYLRLKNLEVNYKLHKNLTKRLGISSVVIYLNGNNLLTWTKLDTRLDPETKNNTVYPIIKRYNVGMRLTF